MASLKDLKDGTLVRVTEGFYAGREGQVVVPHKGIDSEHEVGVFFGEVLDGKDTLVPFGCAKNNNVFRVETLEII